MKDKAYTVRLEVIVVANSPQQGLERGLEEILKVDPNKSCLFAEIFTGGNKIAIVDVAPVVAGQSIKVEDLEWVDY